MFEARKAKRQAIATQKVFNNSSQVVRNYFKVSEKRQIELHKERLAAYRQIADFVGRKEKENTVNNVLGNISKLFGLGGAAAGGLGLRLLGRRGGGPRITGGGGFRNPFRSRPQITGSGTPRPGGPRITGSVQPARPGGILSGIKGFKFKPPAGAAGLKPSGIPILGIAMTGLDYADRRSAGQTQTQAAVGSVATTLGGVASAKAAAVALSPLLVAPVPGARIIYGLGVLGAGLVGAFGTQKLADNLTGADKKLPAEESSNEDRLKKLLEQQIEPTDSPAAVALSESLDVFDRIVTKLETYRPFAKKEEDRVVKIDLKDLEEGDPTRRRRGPTNVEPIEGIFPLPGGVLSTEDVGFPGGEYGAERAGGREHLGQDIGGLPPGSAVVAFKGGQLKIEGQDRYGQDIIMIDHGDGVYTRYLHVKASVQDGEVTAGQQIGVLGPKTKSWDEHLHFEILKGPSREEALPIDPLPSLRGAERIPKPIPAPKEQASLPELEKPMVASAGLNIESMPIFLPFSSGKPQRAPMQVAMAQPPAIILGGESKGLTHGQLFALGLDRFS